MTVTSINLRVTWDAVCDALGIPFHSKALPLRTSCPLCSKPALTLYHDNITQGVWHHCQACHSSGDMLELAGAVWNVGPDAALHRLSREGLNLPPELLEPSLIEDYLRNLPGCRARFNALWRESQKHIVVARSPYLDVLRRQHSLCLNVSPERWEAGPAHLLGANTAPRITEVFYPADQNAVPGARHNIFITGARTGRRPRSYEDMGERWHEVLVSPWYDMPDRIRGFSFMGRYGRRPIDEVYKAITKRTETQAGRHEAGLAGLNTATVTGSGPDVIAVDDWLLSLQLQMRIFRTAIRPIQLVVWRDDGVYRTRFAWNALSSKRIIFWAPQLDCRVIRQAIDVDGYISTSGPTTPEFYAMQHYLTLHPGKELQRMIVKHAKPWPAALGDWMGSNPPGVVHELMIALERVGVDLSYVWRRVGRRDATVGDFGSIAIVPPKRTLKLQYGHELKEQGDTWQIVRSGQQATIEMCNFILRLTHTIKDQATDELWYKGFFRMKGQQLPFIERVATVRKKPHTWAADKLLDAGLGVAFVRRPYRHALHDLAVQMHEPEFIVDDLAKHVKQLRETLAPL